VGISPSINNWVSISIAAWYALANEAFMKRITALAIVFLVVLSSLEPRHRPPPR
jgi:hypothetical protein